MEDSEKDKIIRELQKEVRGLKNQIIINQDQDENAHKYADLLNDLFHKGIIHEDGEFIQDEA